MSKQLIDKLAKALWELNDAHPLLKDADDYLAKPEPEPIGYTSQHQIDWSPENGHDPIWWFEKHIPTSDDDNLSLPFIEIPLYTSPPCKKLSDADIWQAVVNIESHKFVNKKNKRIDYSKYDLAIARAVLKAAGYE